MSINHDVGEGSLDARLLGSGQPAGENTHDHHDCSQHKDSVWDYLWFVLAVDLQGVSFGFTLAFTSMTLGGMVHDLDLCGSSWEDDDQLCSAGSWLVSCAAAASLVGGLLGGPAASTLGRRPTYLINGAVFSAGYLMIGFAKDPVVLFVGRALTGLAAGTAGVVAPMYVAETSPKNLRGQLGCLFNIGIATGVLLVNLLCHRWIGLSWRHLAWIAGNVPPLGSMAAMYMFPESPQFLTARICRAASLEEQVQANKQLCGSLQWLHGADEDACQRDAEGRARLYRAASQNLSVGPDLFDAADNAEMEQSTAAPQLCDRRHRFAAFLGVGVVVGFGLSAINCVNAYTGTILDTAGVEDEETGSTGYAATQLIVALVGLRYADRFSRKTLLVTSASGCAASLLVCSLGFLGGDKLNVCALLGAVSFVGFISVGLGPFSWVYASEILPDVVRDQGMSMAIALFWGLTFLQQLVFSDAIDAFGGTATFVFFALCNLVVAVLFATFLVETRGRSLQEIQALVLGSDEDTPTKPPLCDVDVDQNSRAKHSSNPLH